MMHIGKSKRLRKDAGIALVTTLLLLLLMTSLLVGFSILLVSDQQLAAANNDQVRAFYGAEAGLEQLTASLGNLFDQTYSPSKSQIAALTTTPPTISGIQYQLGDGTSGFQIKSMATDSNGNPAPTITTIKSGTYQGMTAMATEYVLSVNARTPGGREVTLKRTTQTVGIPMFQFGIFSDQDLSFFPGPDFNFGGRTHTNGNLFLAAGGTLKLSDKVDAYKDVIRYTLSNGYVTTSNYGGTVNITTSPGTSSYRALAITEGSLTKGIGSAGNTNWSSISLGASNYAGNLLNGAGTSSKPSNATGAKMLNLGIVTIGSGATQNIDLIRRPAPNEAQSVTAERYFAQASLKILLSDNKSDLLNLNCVDASSKPLDLSTLTGPPAGWTGDAATLYTMMTANGVVPEPLATSGASTAYSASDGYFLPGGYPIIKGWILIEAQLAPYGNPCGTWKDVTLEVLSQGFVGRNIDPVTQSLDGATLNPQWVQNTNTMESGKTPAMPYLPQYVSSGTTTTLSAMSYQNGAAYDTSAATLNSVFKTPAFASTTGAKVCPDLHPNAILRLERLRDNPSTVAVATGKLSTSKPYNYPVTSTVGQVCGMDATTGKASTALVSTDFWPNVLFDTREGTLRDTALGTATTITGTGTGALKVQVPPQPSLNGAMQYVEIDMANLVKWFAGKLGTTGPATFDSVVAPNNFLVYFSDRRGNYVNATSWGAWPPLSPSANETGEYGWYDLVNQSNATTGCPDNKFDTGEDNSGQNTLFTYGANSSYYSYIDAPGVALGSLKAGQLGVFNNLNSGTPSALSSPTGCTTAPSYSSAVWPMMVANVPGSLRENPPLFFRRAVKLVNGQDLSGLPTCPTGNTCGLAIAAENPVYIQGNFNANSTGNQWSDPFVPSSVAGDAVTLLSVQWNDVNSFVGPYSTTYRQGVTTYYRTAIIGGSTLSFPQPSGTSQDYGTDGGVHNFLRYIETWSGTLNYQGSIVALYTSRQAMGTFKCCSTVYNPPTRGYSFDITFLNPVTLPPRTPLFRDVNTTGFSQILTPGVYQ